MSNMQLQADLSTPEGFARRVVIREIAVYTAVNYFALGSILLVIRTTTTLRSLTENPGTDFFELFFSSSRDSSGASILAGVLAWLAIVAVPTSVIYFFYGLRKLAHTREQAYLAYRSGGHLAQQRPIGLRAQIPRGSAVDVHALGTPAIPAEVFDNSTSELKRFTSTLGYTERRALVAKLLPGLREGVQPATVMLASMPTALLLTRGIGTSEWVVVVPAESPGGQPRLFAVKH